MSRKKNSNLGHFFKLKKGFRVKYAGVVDCDAVT